MSNTQTQFWLEQKYEVFRYGMETEDWELCKNVIDDFGENGFWREGIELSKEMLTKKMSVNEY